MASRILLVDDEIAILLPFRKLLEDSACQVDTAETIEETEALLKEHHYDVVIADLRLTGVLGEEGLEIIRYVRDQGIETSVILMTGYGSPDVMNRAYELGAAFYFEKPVSVTALRSALAELRVLAP